MSTSIVQLKEMIAKLVTVQHAEKRYTTLKDTAAALNQEWQELDQQLANELDDIEKLESLSMKALFHKVLGSKEEQIEKERQEYLAVNLKVKELNNTIEITEYEISVLKTKVAEKESLLQAFEQAKSEREAEILRNNEPQKEQLVAIIRKEESIIKLKQEIIEAIEAGKVALRAVGATADHLKKAHEWGEWDMMNRAGYYDQMKHNAIDYASQEAYQAKHKLSMFKEELADIGYNDQSFHFNIESFSKFTDVFFDNLISDWIMQQRIKNVFANVEATFDKVATILKALEKYLLDQDQALIELNKDRESAIVA